MNKIFGMIGLAAGAGKIAYGDSAVCKNIICGKAKLVILAKNCGDNINSKIKKLCYENEVKCVEFSDKESIGKAVGKDDKAVIAITDDGFAQAVLKLINTAN